MSEASTPVDTQSTNPPQEVRIFRPFVKWVFTQSYKDAWGWLRHPKQRFADFKVRYSKPEPLIAWQLSSVITALQITVGAKLWAWCSLKAPGLVAFIGKVGIFLKATVVKIFQVISTVCAAIAAKIGELF